MRAARPALLLALTLPFTAHAIPIAGNRVVIEYEGTITQVQDRPEYTVGDRIAGRLFIDLGIEHFRQTNGSPIGTIYESGSPAFVSGFRRSLGDGFDTVALANDVSRPGSGMFDHFGIEDLLVGHLAPLDHARTFSLNAHLRGFLTSEALEDLRFDLTTADIDEPNESMSGGIRWSNLGPFAFVHFAVDRLKATQPGRCVP
jgi:hypothetical protein